MSDNDSENNSQPPYNRVVLCLGPYCSLGNRSKRMFQMLQLMIDDINDSGYPRVKLTTSNCLDMCGLAPVLVLYPGGLAFDHLEEEDLASIVDTYLTPPDETT